MIRKLLHWLLILSVLMFTLLWVRSYWKKDMLSIWKMPYSAYVGDSYGQLGLSIGIWHDPRERLRNPNWEISCEADDANGPLIPDIERVAGASAFNCRLGSFALYNKDTPRWRAIGLIIPFWLIGLFWALATWLVWKPSGKTKFGEFCPQCGYDLRVSERRCPECGAPIDAKKTRISGHREKKGS